MSLIDGIYYENKIKEELNKSRRLEMNNIHKKKALENSICKTCTLEPICKFKTECEDLQVTLYTKVILNKTPFNVNLKCKYRHSLVKSEHVFEKDPISPEEVEEFEKSLGIIEE